MTEVQRKKLAIKIIRTWMFPFKVSAFILLSPMLWTIENCYRGNMTFKKIWDDLDRGPKESP